VIVATAWLHHRRAPTGLAPTWILLGALVLLPMSILVAEGTGDPSIVGWTGADLGGLAEFLHVFGRLVWVGIFAVVVFVFHRTWPRAVAMCLRALAWALAVVCSTLFFATITTAPTQRLEVLDPWIDALPALPAYRDAQTISFARFVSVPAPPFFERAYVLSFSPNESWRDRQTFVMPDGEGTLSLRGQMLQMEGARAGCFVSHEADRVVIASSLRGWAMFTHEGRERVCSLTHDSFHMPWVPASNAGLVGLTVPREVPAMLGVAALLAVALLGVATRARRRAGVLADYVEATLIPGGEAPSTVRLPDGSLARLEGDSPSTSAVLVAPSRGDTGYREDVRRTVHVWVAAGVGRDEVIARLRREVETAEASALVIAAWLSMPAFVAWAHGHVISPW
jgi:hypothetical protein